MNAPTLTLFYDGLCPLCSREINYYRKRAGDDASIQFLDITAPGFDAAGHGLDAAKIHREMHVKVGDEVHVGVKAFLALWRRIPGFHWMARLGSLPVVYPFLWLGYALFARVRPWLPRRKAACDSGTCPR